MKIAMMIVGGVALGIALAFVLGFVVQALWNWLMPGLFGLPQVTYWQAWGLLILAHLLLGGGPRFHHTDKHSLKNSGHGNFRDEVKMRFCGASDPAPEPRDQ